MLYDGSERGIIYEINLINGELMVPAAHTHSNLSFNFKHGEYLLWFKHYNIQRFYLVLKEINNNGGRK